MQSAPRPFLASCLVLVLLAAALLGSATAASAQIGGVVEQIPIPDLPDELEDPLVGIVDTVGEGIIGAVGDIPLDNALVLLGDDGVEAAINLSRATFADGQSPVALIGRSTIFADSLSSGGAQGVVQAPLLVTAETELDERVVAELERLGVTQVVVLGEEQAIAPSVVAALEGMGLRVDRLGGITRVETAIAVAAALLPDATHAILARAYPEVGGEDSQAYVDSLSVGPWAAEEEWPILLTQTGVLTTATAEYLVASDITSVTVVGGEQAIGPAVVSALEGLGIAVDRVAGDNRFATAVAVANARGYATAADMSRLILAEVDGHEDVWVPGFAAAANGGLFDGPILLTDGLTLPAETLAFILDSLPDNLLDLGGAPVICTSFVSLVACEAAALLLLGAVAEAVELLDELPLPVAEILCEVTGGCEDPPADDPPPEDPPADDPPPEDPPPDDGCALPPPIPCLPPPATTT